MKIVSVQIRFIKIYGILIWQSFIKIPSSKQVLNPQKSNLILTLDAIEWTPPIFVLRVHLYVKEMYEILDISKHWVLGWLYNIPYKMVLAFLSKHWNFLKTPKGYISSKTRWRLFFLYFLWILDDSQPMFRSWSAVSKENINWWCRGSPGINRPVTHYLLCGLYLKVLNLRQESQYSVNHLWLFEQTKFYLLGLGLSGQALFPLFCRYLKSVPLHLIQHSKLMLIYQ